MLSAEGGGKKVKRVGSWQLAVGSFEELEPLDLPPTAYRLLLTAYCLPPTADCLLPTADCLLLTASWLTAHC